MSQTFAPNLHPFKATCFFNPHSAAYRADVAVSACLAGEKVRYDGAHKLLPIYAHLQAELNLIPICPELGAGLGVPRPPVQLVDLEGKVQARGRDDHTLDVTLALQKFAHRSFSQLNAEHSLCGYLWKSRSPSCGLGSTPLFDTHGNAIKRANGLQADYFVQYLPHINHCEETALSDERAVIIFVLRCRLVFDMSYASATSLRNLHRHYDFLYERFDKHSIEKLNTHAESDNKQNYLAALLNGCSQISNDDLLREFT